MTEPTQKPGDPNKGSQLPANQQEAHIRHYSLLLVRHRGTKPVEPPKAGSVAG